MSVGVPDLEVLLVDDNSPDGTADLAERLSPQYGGRVRVPRRPGKMGLGTAYVAGFASAIAMGAEYVVEMDADLSHEPEDVPRLLAKMAAYDVAVGSRWVKGGSADPGWGWARKALSSWGSVYARFILGLKVRDTTTGFQCFRRQALEGPADRAHQEPGLRLPGGGGLRLPAPALPRGGGPHPVRPSG